jgi:hypothetical protein
MIGRRRHLPVVVGVGASALLGGGYVGTSTAAKTTPQTVLVIAGRPTEHAFELSRTSVKRGRVIIKVLNLGRERHGFQIDGHITALLAPHTSTTFAVIFRRPGRYVYQCVVNYASADDVPDAGPVSTYNPATCGGGALKVT